MAADFLYFIRNLLATTINIGTRNSHTEITKAKWDALMTQRDRTLAYFELGAPVVEDTDKIVVSADMKVGTYTIAAQPDVPRNLTLTHTAGGTADTLGTVTVLGTNIDDEVISEVFTPVSGTKVVGTKAFKTVTSATGAGWAIDAVEGTKDTIIIGVGNKLGLPIIPSAAAAVKRGFLDSTGQKPTVVYDADELEKNTVDLSAGTYNGTKIVSVDILVPAV